MIMDELRLAELKLRVEADDPAALFEYSNIIAETDPTGAEKFLLLSAQLGHPPALERAGDLHMASGNTAEAERCYRTCAKAGMLDCAVKLLAIKLKEPAEETVAVRELEELAVSGVTSAALALADYYSDNGNRKQAAYWRSTAK